MLCELRPHFSKWMRPVLGEWESYFFLKENKKRQLLLLCNNQKRKRDWGKPSLFCSKKKKSKFLFVCFHFHENFLFLKKNFQTCFFSSEGVAKKKKKRNFASWTTETDKKVLTLPWYKKKSRKTDARA